MTQARALIGLSQIADNELKLYLIPDIVNIINQYTMTNATIKTEYYQAIITGDLTHIKWIHNKYPTVHMKDLNAVKIALEWQQFVIFDYLCKTIDCNDDLTQCLPFPNIEHTKRMSTEIYDFKILLRRTNCDNPNILALPVSINYINSDFNAALKLIIDQGNVNMLYHLLNKKQYRQQMVSYLNNGASYYQSNWSNYADRELESAIICDFLGIETGRYCSSNNCNNLPQVKSEFCKAHELVGGREHVTAMEWSGNDDTFDDLLLLPQFNLLVRQMPNIICYGRVVYNKRVPLDTEAIEMVKALGIPIAECAQVQT